MNIKEYDYINIERNWQEFWKKTKLFPAMLNKHQKSFTTFCMYPYPSGIFIWDISGITLLEM